MGEIPDEIREAIKEVILTEAKAAWDEATRVERERCAKIAEEYPVRSPSGDGSVIADEITAAIRASPPSKIE